MAYYAGHIRFHTVRGHYHRGDPGLFSFVKNLVHQPMVQNLIKQGIAAGGQAFGIPMPVTEVALGALMPAAHPPEQASPPEQVNVGGGIAQVPQPMAMQQPHYLPTSERSEVGMEEEGGEEEYEEEEDEG